MIVVKMEKPWRLLKFQRSLLFDWVGSKISQHMENRRLILERYMSNQMALFLWRG